jgi:transcriptional regulator GlxA family with amidase domain
VKRAQVYLNKNLGEGISRWKLAETVHASEDYLTRIFKKELGLSPWEYLLRLRIQAARTLLRSSADSISAVAEAVGFQDQAYFCRVFKKYETRTPREYRNDSSS